ncbi:MAG: phosphatidylglycerophosphatase A [Acidobacteriia bacterium]|nr:phosphatidylglycerophosphatase A [Terriglobia bacterium]
MTTTASAPESSTVAQKTAWAWLIGTFFWIGKLKPGPGTWASVATVGLWRAFAPFAGGHQIPVAIAAAALVTAVGIPASTRVARESARKDPGFVVIDEVAGQLIALIGAPLHWKTLLVSLILFRAFDIVKPPPLRRLEDLPEGAGIMLDDVGAGLYALAVMQALRHWGLLP